MAAPEGLERYLGVLRRRWLVVCAVTVAILAVSVGVTLRQKRLYAADSEVLVNRNNLAAIVGAERRHMDLLPETSANDGDANRRCHAN